MANIFEIAKINPLRVIWQANKLAQDSGTIHYQAFNPSFNTKDFDSAFYYDSIRYYEQKEGYCQPYQQSDTIIFQFMTNDNVHTHYTAQLLDKDGLLYSTIGNPYEFSATYDSLSAYRFTIPLYNIAEGTYFLRIQYYDGVSEQVLIISEPFEVKQIHPKTIRIDYHNSFNDWSYVFESGVVPQFRVHGCISEVKPDSKFNVYEDQPLNTEMVSGIAFRQLVLSVGHGRKGVPEWIADKLERIFLCDTIKVEGKAVTRESGSKWEKNNNDGLPLSWYSLKLRERYNTDTYNIAQLTSIVGDMPQTRFFFIEDMTIDGSTVNVRKGFNGKRNFLDYLNSSQNTTEGYWGEDVNNKLIFVKYEGATVSTNTLSAANTLAYGTRYTVKGAGDLELDITNNTGGTVYYAVVPNNGGANTNKTSLTNTSVANIAKTFTGTSVKEFYLYVSDMSEFYDDATNISIISLGGDFPPNMLSFKPSNIPNDITQIENNPFKYVTSMEAYDISGLRLNTYAVDDVLRYLYDSRSHLDATCDVILTQTVAAPPSRDCLQFKSAIDAVIDTITTD